MPLTDIPETLAGPVADDDPVALVGDALQNYCQGRTEQLGALLAAEVVYQVTPTEHRLAGHYEGPEEFLDIFAQLVGPGGLEDAKVIPGSPTAAATIVQAHIHAVDHTGTQPDMIRFEFNDAGKVVFVYHIHRSVT